MAGALLLELAALELLELLLKHGSFSPMGNHRSQGLVKERVVLVVA